MSVAELKEEAKRQFAMKIESTEDEQVLKSILDFLGDLDSQNVNLARHYGQIKEQYSSVLKKLAE